MGKMDYIKYCRKLVIENIDTGKYAVFLFGSRAHDQHPEKADIDIGILGEQELPESVRYDLKNKIEESEIPYNVDIIDFKRASESFRKVALRKIKLWTRPSHIKLD